MALMKGHGTDADKEFRAALKERLKESAHPKYRIAMDLGISQGQLSGILTNTRSASLGLMEKIAKGLGTTIADMLLEGRAILNPDKSNDPFTNEQKRSIEAFKVVINSNDFSAKMIVNNVLDYARTKEAGAEIENPTPATQSKSA